MRTVLILLFVLIPLVGKAQEYSLEQYLEKLLLFVLKDLLEL